MKKTITFTSLLLICFTLSIPVVFCDSSARDDSSAKGDSSDYRYSGLKKMNRLSVGVQEMNNVQYQEECGSCHMAYQPGLLPAWAWENMMANLDQHYGDNAELDPSVHASISQYLLNASADKAEYRLSKKFMYRLEPVDGMIRISKTPYFIGEHDEIPSRMVVDNKQVNSFSHCDACHSKAKQGIYDEHHVAIPGYPGWED